MAKKKNGKGNQLSIDGTGRKKLPDLVAAAEALADAKSVLAEAKADVSVANVDLMILCRKYLESGDLTVDLEKHAESKIPVYIYQVEDGEELITREISHGFVEGCGVKRTKRDDGTEANAA